MVMGMVMLMLMVVVMLMGEIKVMGVINANIDILMKQLFCRTLRLSKNIPECETMTESQGELKYHS